MQNFLRYRIQQPLRSRRRAADSDPVSGAEPGRIDFAGRRDTETPGIDSFAQIEEHPAVGTGRAGHEHHYIMLGGESLQIPVTGSHLLADSVVKDK